MTNNLNKHTEGYRIMKKYLTLSDGTTFEGLAFGDHNALAAGEVVFNTGMTGYQEAITDPSYTNQLLTFTYPLIGTYGIFKNQNQSSQSTCQAVLVRHLENEIGDANLSLDAWLKDLHIPGMSNLDTRALTKHIRQHGTLKAIIANEPLTVADFNTLYPTLSTELSKKPQLQHQTYLALHADYHVVVIDFGIKQGIISELLAANCDVTVLPYTTSLADIKQAHPDGILISNGPDDPSVYTDYLPLIQQLEACYPVAGICLGHQLLALANGAKTYLLPFGHRGLNHPVKLLTSNHTIMTSQNHGYAVDPASLKDTDLVVTAVEGDDHTIEGLAMQHMPVISVQFHPEANPGPLDATNFFHQFKQLMHKEVKLHA